MLDAMAHHCSNFNCGVIKMPLKLGHRWLITFHYFYVDVIICSCLNPDAGLAIYLLVKGVLDLRYMIG